MPVDESDTALAELGDRLVAVDQGLMESLLTATADATARVRATDEETVPSAIESETTALVEQWGKLADAGRASLNEIGIDTSGEGWTQAQELSEEVLTEGITAWFELTAGLTDSAMPALPVDLARQVLAAAGGSGVDVVAAGFTSPRGLIPQPTPADPQAFASGVLASKELKAQGLTFVQWRWRYGTEVRDEFVWHRRLNGRFTDKDGTVGGWYSGDHRGCIVAGTVVEGPVASAATLRHYEGTVIDLTFASGKFLTITPNHPVLTPKGWVAAGLLAEGGYVVGRFDSHRATSLVPDDYQSAARIEDVVERLRLADPAPLAGMRTTEEHFHGDGGGSAMAVMVADPAMQQKQLAALARPDGPDVLAWDADPVGVWFALSGVASDRGAMVGTDEIVAVSEREFSGDVFNLQTTPGWYVAEGVIVHNCRCGYSPVWRKSKNAQDLVSSRYASGVKAAAHGAFSGAIVSLVPSEADAARLAVEGFEPADQLHLTLAWLGDTEDAETQPEMSFEDAIARVTEALAGVASVEAEAFGVAVFNPASDERDPATVLLIQGEALSDVADKVRAAVGDASSFAIWLPHLTVAYNMTDALPDADIAERMGPVTFDRAVVAFGSDQVEVVALGEEAEVKTVTAAVRFRELMASATGPAVEGPIVFESVATGDKRMFEADSLVWDEVPIPLICNLEDMSHWGAVVGTLTELARDGDSITARGNLSESDHEETAEDIGRLVELLDEGAIGVSVLVDDETVKFIDANGNEVDPMSDDESIDWDEVLMVTSHARIRHVAFVDVPAFAEARLSLVASVEDLAAAVIGDADLDIAEREREWDGDEAKARVFDLCTNEAGEVDVACVSRAFLYRDDDADMTTQAAYSLGFCDEVNGRLQIVARGVFATAGGRGVDATDIADETKDRIKERICGLYEKLSDHFEDDSILCPFADEEASQTIEASAWAAVKAAPPLPAAFFAEPVGLPQDAGPVHVDGGRIYGWVARRGVAHEVLGREPPLDDVDLTTFLRHETTLDDGSQVRVGAFTMDVGHHRDGAECETAACQFDDTRTVAGIVTVGVNEGGMWFSGAAAPWLSEWDRHVFAACAPSGHWRHENGGWSLRGVLTVPMPGYPTTLAASAVVHRANTALRSMPEADAEAEAVVVVRLEDEQMSQITASVVGHLDRRRQRDELSERVRRVEIERMKEKVDGLRALR